jgi:sugar transferase (PEP-CTERM/EpsH1 system associated)
MHLLLSLNVGGMEWVVVNLLKKLNRNMFNPVMVCLVKGGSLVTEVKKLNCPVIILNKPEKLDFSVSFRLAKVIREKKIELIHTHNTGAYIYGTIAAKLAGCGVIIHTEHGRYFPDKKRLMVAEKILSNFTYRIVTVSEALKNDLIKFEKINPEKISVITNGIDLKHFKPLAKNVIRQKKHELGLDKNDFVIGNIGRLVSVKGHRDLIQAFSLVHKSLPKVKLVIAGDGPLKDDLINFSQSLRLQKNILFLGERNDILELLNTFDIFVLPSKSEGISLTLLEAMAVGKPVVATSVGGNKEIIENGKDGYLVPAQIPKRLGEIILNIVKTYKNNRELGVLAYEKVREKYSLDKMVNDYQNVYESALVVD